jgi:Mlc titration factor MtfA (ptsG expression regulator)
VFSLIRNWNRRRILRRHRIPAALWRSAIAEVNAAAHLSDADVGRLRDTASLFLYEKAIEPARGVTVSDTMRARIACEAAVPILNLGLDYYHAFYSVIVYNEAFLARDVYRDEAGVIHSGESARAGEAWLRGPVVISWEDVISRGHGYNVIIHEMAHKLDMLDGAANGRPPMQRGMDQARWTKAFSQAYAEHTADVAAGRHTRIDPYAATNPAEFFAVASEAFFESPRLLESTWPAVYEQLVLYYRQEP